jgi:tRNA-binding protein
MATQIKPTADKASTFDKLDIRVGRVTSVEIEPDAPKKSYRIKVDFGKFGVKQTVARLTSHTPEELAEKIVVGVLNFEPRTVGKTNSEFLLLGPQYPKAGSGEASFLTTDMPVKIGGKIF